MCVLTRRVPDPVPDIGSRLPSANTMARLRPGGLRISSSHAGNGVFRNSNGVKENSLGSPMVLPMASRAVTVPIAE